MSLTPSQKLSSCQRRRSVGTSGSSCRYTHSDISSTNTYPGRVKALEGGPTARTYPNTPRRQAKHAACSDNHGIRPPTPEQYLTPLQQKEVCIRHLRARLRDNVERLQHRDCEIDELRTQLYRMQEEWIEGECHRVEAQLALKEARKEIQHLQGVVESVKSNLGVHESDAPDNKPYPGLQAARPGGRSRSCGCSPASTLSRNTSYKRMSNEALQLDRSLNTSDPSGVPRPPAQTHLLLEAALCSEQLPASSTVPRSSTFERLCSGGAVLPLSHSCHSLSSSCRCNGHSPLPHHHLFLHLPQEEPPLTVTPVPASDPIPTPAPATERKAEMRSQACSPTMTWIREDRLVEELSIISTTPHMPPSEPCPPLSLPPACPIQHVCSVGSSPCDLQNQATKTVAYPQTSQPHPTVHPLLKQESTVLEIKEETDEANTERSPPQRYHWSRYFLVDLLALAMPVVPTMAWLCRGAQREDMPVYQIGSLLRGCCAVALHSLRQQGLGRERCRSHDLNGTT